MSQDQDQGIDDFIAGMLLRYFRDGTGVSVRTPRINRSRDLDWLRLHWALSSSVRLLVEHLQREPHEIATVLETTLCVGDCRVGGPLDARATLSARRSSGNPALVAFREPRRSYVSGPNHVLIWVIDQAWRLAIRFCTLAPPGSSYRGKAESCLRRVETVRRFERIREVAKGMDINRRPGVHAIKEAARSRRPVYRLASAAFQCLLGLERGDSQTVNDVVSETVLGPLRTWQRFELAVGMAMAHALSQALGATLRLGLFAGGEPIASVGPIVLYWQTRTRAWRGVEAEPSEIKVASVLEAYDLTGGADRPDLVVLESEGGAILALAEVKYSADGSEEAAADGLRAAVQQLVRYARGYLDLQDIDALLGRSIVGLSGDAHRWQNARREAPFVAGLPAILGADLRGWAKAVLEAHAHKVEAVAS